MLAETFSDGGAGIEGAVLRRGGKSAQRGQ
jgi:hypothetical protein